jgi:hypothetical protein
LKKTKCLAGVKRIDRADIEFQFLDLIEQNDFVEVLGEGKFELIGN